MMTEASMALFERLIRSLTPEQGDQVQAMFLGILNAEQQAMLRQLLAIEGVVTTAAVQREAELKGSGVSGD